MTDLPAAAITAAARQLAHYISGTERAPWPEPDQEDILWATRALEAAAPHIAAAAWRDGYGLGRDDEADNLPLRGYTP